MHLLDRACVLHAQYYPAKRPDDATRAPKKRPPCPPASLECRTGIVTVFGVAGWIASVVLGAWTPGLLVLGAGVVVAGAVTTVPWPLYQRDPIKWLPARPKEEARREDRATSAVDIALSVVNGAMLAGLVIFMFLLFTNPNRPFAVGGLTIDLRPLTLKYPVLGKARTLLARKLTKVPRLGSAFRRVLY